MANKWSYSIFFVLFLMFVSFIISGLLGLSVSPSYGNVLVISLNGPILSHSPGGSIFGAEASSSSSFIIETLRTAQEDSSIKAVVFSIDSPGGSAVASQEIVEAVKKIDKPTIAVVRSVGASGAYWVASATDKIYANPLSIVGSIGVTSSYLEFSGLLERYNITYERLVSGDHKDMGSPFRSLTDEEREMLLEQINLVHDYFVEDVASNRLMDKSEIELIATGQVFMGAQALSNGLIDELGNLDDVQNHLEELLNSTVSFRYVQQRRPLFDFVSVVGDNFAFNFGKGFASWVTQERNSEVLWLT